MEQVEVLQGSVHIWHTVHRRLLNDGCCSQRQAAGTHERWEAQGVVVPGRVLPITASPAARMHFKMQPRTTRALEDSTAEQRRSMAKRKAVRRSKDAAVDPAHAPSEA